MTLGYASWYLVLIFITFIVRLENRKEIDSHCYEELFLMRLWTVSISIILTRKTGK